MKKLYLILLSVFALLNTAVAQELMVKSFVLAPTDITAQTEGRKDLNGDACALVKISFVGDVADVEGNVIKPLVRRNNETWAFMTQESRQMKVVTKDYLPLMVTFGDYGIEKLQGNRTYVLTLTKPSGASETQQMQTLTIKYSPITASVLVDNKFIKGSNGVANTSLPIGQHSYIIACDGYESEEGMVKLKASAPSNLQITLSKEVASMNQTSKTAIPQQAQPQQPVAQPQPVSSMASSSTSGASSNMVGSSTSGSVITIPVKDGISIEMVKVEAGSFNMGATPEMQNPDEDEKPVHRVTLTNNYYIGKYEVTQALWKTVMGNKSSRFKGDNLPVEKVSWNNCQKFISKLNKLTGKSFCLPTEAEWEFAARGGKKSRGYQYSGSNTLGDVAWYEGNSGSKTHAVGTKQPNELGIYDMTGNVYEWCQDWYGSYSSSPQTNPIGAVSGSCRVYRGGCWVSSARNCRTSYRGRRTPDFRYGFLGLRLVLSE
jgi:formylglycine-generating enzyme required for sulfatase activity|nr:formylglycine-generating enzyme family protein [uncultured Prevotella sp.]